MKIAIIFEAFKAIFDLVKKPTPNVGVKIQEGARALEKIGHSLNIGAAIGAVAISAIGIGDFEMLYAWYEKDKLFFFIVLGVMQTPYIVSSYMRLAGKVQAESVS